MRTIPIIFISILFLGCNTPRNSSNIEREVKTVVGTWEFVSNKITETNPSPDSPAFQLKNDSTYNILQVFGPEILKELEGKRIQFFENNQLKSDIIEGNGLGILNFEYQFDYHDSLITFTFMIPKDSSKVYVPTKTILRDSSMIWNIDDFMEIKLRRLE